MPINPEGQAKLYIAPFEEAGLTQGVQPRELYEPLSSYLGRIVKHLSSEKNKLSPELEKALTTLENHQRTVVKMEKPHRMIPQHRTSMPNPSTRKTDSVARGISKWDTTIGEELPNMTGEVDENEGDKENIL